MFTSLYLFCFDIWNIISVHFSGAISSPLSFENFMILHTLISNLFILFYTFMFNSLLNILMSSASCNMFNVASIMFPTFSYNFNFSLKIVMVCVVKHWRKASESLIWWNDNLNHDAEYCNKVFKSFQLMYKHKYVHLILNLWK